MSALPRAASGNSSMRNSFIPRNTPVRSVNGAFTVPREHWRQAVSMPPPQKIDVKAVEYLLYVAWKGKLVSYKKSELSYLKRYLKFYKNDVIKKMKIVFPQDMRVNVHWLDEEQYQKLLSVEMTPLQRMVIHLELCMGLRNAECCRLTLKDIYNNGTKPYLKKIWLADCDGGTNGDVLVIHITDGKLDSKYLYYVLSSDAFFHYDVQHSKGAKMPRGDKKAIMEYMVPIPPLPIQEEIIRILDTFTELTAELTLRKKQYEFYRDKLLSFDGLSEKREKLGVRWMRIKSISLPVSRIKWQSCNKTKQYIDLTSVDISSHNIIGTTQITRDNAPCRAQQIVNSNDVLFATTRPIQGRCCILPSEYEDQICSSGYCVLRVDSKIVLPEWIYFHLCTSNFIKYVELHQEGASYPEISDSKIKQYLIPIPPLEIQERIVHNLQQFETLCNNVVKGLPSEIEARRKQYEYYRDKLLSFEEVKA